ncbi:nucleotide pyrophosphohydrolase [Acholeplasma equirhinis]|uniref:nucleotide pyrophosphohydrolase n=1 Tax=Acholeplasma equirhinis TaxID=555393 RepID=UPI00197AC939|nr:nucleotide pyrophosphohydrolase [Acholeplasma equirhinis]MBN3490613.1 nucleotide pyrophosphohydrolase [Acholeplasma equirhinis]
MKEIIAELLKFRDERNWKQFHTPENLAKSIIIEASELLENFQWGSEKVDVENVKDELADIIAYCIYLCHEYDFNINEILQKKIIKNKEKYPIDKSFGKSDKYTKL